MIRKNKKFIDPRYFMDEKLEEAQQITGFEPLTPEAPIWLFGRKTTLGQAAGSWEELAVRLATGAVLHARRKGGEWRWVPPGVARGSGAVEETSAETSIFDAGRYYDVSVHDMYPGHLMFSFRAPDRETAEEVKAVLETALKSAQPDLQALREAAAKEGK